MRPFGRDRDHHFDFRQYKDQSLARRIRRRMRQVRIESFAAYGAYLDRHADEYAQLLDVILINVTRFFRDPEAWAVIRDSIIPRLVQEAGDVGVIRVWCAGCSTGEEPYTVAILLAEALRARSGPLPEVKIYATDVDMNALAAARSGLYRLEQLKDVPPECLDRHFAAERPQIYRVNRELRKSCIFGSHNLVQDPPLARIDLLVCRNVMIYFDGELQERLLPRFHYALRERGILFLGKSETLLARSRRFAPIDPKWRIFERQTPASPDRLPRQGPAATANGAAEGNARPVRAEGGLVPFKEIVETIDTAVVVIDVHDTVILWNPAADALFDLPADVTVGRKFRDLSISYRIEGLRARIEEVRTKKAASRMDTVLVARASGPPVYASIMVAPLHDERQRVSAVLVAADDVSNHANLKEEMNRLGEEYATATEELQSTNEELETTNEELQSTNEELEATNEELQATNAELAAVNAELERRTVDLDRSDTHLQKILATLGDGTFSLDRALVVTVWNRAMASMAKLTADRAIGKEFLVLPLGSAAPQVFDAVNKAVTEKRKHIVPKIPCDLPDGSRGLGTLSVTPLMDDGGEVSAVVGVLVAEEPGHGG